MRTSESEVSDYANLRRDSTPPCTPERHRSSGRTSDDDESDEDSLTPTPKKAAEYAHAQLATVLHRPAQHFAHAESTFKEQTGMNHSATSPTTLRRKEGEEAHMTSPLTQKRKISPKSFLLHLTPSSEDRSSPSKKAQRSITKRPAATVAGCQNITDFFLSPRTPKFPYNLPTSTAQERAQLNQAQQQQKHRLPLQDDNEGEFGTKVVKREDSDVVGTQFHSGTRAVSSLPNTHIFWPLAPHLPAAQETQVEAETQAATQVRAQTETSTAAFRNTAQPLRISTKQTELQGQHITQPERAHVSSRRTFEATGFKSIPLARPHRAQMAASTRSSANKLAAAQSSTARANDSMGSGFFAGSIQYIKMENFMSHSNLKIDFKPRMNIITGENGSGKSSILAAIMIAFGGKAATTGRGGKFADLVKYHEKYAKVLIQLCNEGPVAYMQERLGRFIKIERKIVLAQPSGKTNSGSVSATTTLNISGEHGKFSEKREELCRILDHFNIYVDNAFTMLTQDTARELLMSSTPSKLFHFFSKGAEIERTLQTYEASGVKLNNSRVLLSELNDGIQTKGSKRESLSFLAKLLQRRRAIKQRLDDIIAVKPWVDLKEKEEEYNILTTKIRDLKAQLSMKDSELKDLGSKQEEIDAKIQSLHLEAANFERQLKSELLIAEKEQKEMEAKVRELSLQKRNFLDERRRFARENALFDERIKRATEICGGSEVDMRAQLVLEQNDLKQKLTEINNVIAQDEIKVDKAKKKEEDASNALKSAKRDEHRLREMSQTAHERASSFLGLSNDPLTNWGPRMPQIIRDIKGAAAGQWEGPEPMGPIGQYLKPKSEKWLGVLRMVFGPSMSDFIVENDHDRKLLDAILKRHQQRSNIMRIAKMSELSRSSDPTVGIDVNSYKPKLPQAQGDEPFSTVYDEILFGNAVVHYAISVLLNPEQLVLSPTRQDAESLTENGFPRSVRAVYLHSGYTVGSRTGERAMTAPALLRQSQRGQCPFGLNNAEVRSRALWQEYEEAKKNFESHVQRVKLLQNTTTKCLEELELAKQKYLASRKERAIINSKIEDIDKKLEDHSEKNTLSKMLSERDELLNGQRLNEKQINLLEDELKKKNALLEESNKKLRDLRNKQEAEVNSQNKVSELQELSQIKTAAFTKLRYQKERLQGISGKLEELQSQFTKTEQEVNLLRHRVAQAKEEEDQRFSESSNCTSLDTVVPNGANSSNQDNPQLAFSRLRKEKLERWKKISREKYNTVLHKTKEQLAVIEAEVSNTKMTESEVHSKLQELTDEIAHKNKEYIELLRLHEKESNLLVDRKNKFLRLEYVAAARASDAFRLYMRRIGFTGELKFNFQEKQINIMVRLGDTHAGNAPGNAEEVGTARSIQTYSGGEKSYTTVCLIMALWDAMPSPIRVLDEFDVCMDEVMRKFTLDALTKRALSMQDSQCIFISPHAVQNSRAMHEDVAVICLPKPVRQTQPDAQPSE